MESRRGQSYFYEFNQLQAFCLRVRRRGVETTMMKFGKAEINFGAIAIPILLLLLLMMMISLPLLKVMVGQVSYFLHLALSSGPSGCFATSGLSF
jgi:hypothetical protein